MIKRILACAIIAPIFLFLLTEEKGRAALSVFGVFCGVAFALHVLLEGER